MSPADLVNRTAKGGLHNPYKDTQADIVAQGEALFRSYPCSGCHGGGAGGGMCPPLTKSDWIYGGDDDTLFRLVTLGSDQLQKIGYTRMGLAPVVGPMPPMGPIIKSSDDLWKILAFVRSRYDDDPAYKFEPRLRSSSEGARRGLPRTAVAARPTIELMAVSGTMALA